MTALRNQLLSLCLLVSAMAPYADVEASAKPPTKQQCCLKSCKPLKGSSDHAACMHQCMSGKGGC